MNGSKIPGQVSAPERFLADERKLLLESTRSIPEDVAAPVSVVFFEKFGRPEVIIDKGERYRVYFPKADSIKVMNAYRKRGGISAEP